MANAARRLRSKTEQGFDCRRRLRAGTQLEELSEQGQRDDHRCRFVVDADSAAVRRERQREPAGRKRGDKAVAVGSGDAGADQGPHVGTAMPYGVHAAYEKGPSAPQDDGSAQYQFNCGLMRKSLGKQQVAEHRQHEHRDGKRQRPPEPAPEIDQFRIFFLVQRGHQRFQRHPAQRATAGRGVADFRVHRASKNRSRLSSRLFRRLGRVQIGAWICTKFGHAANAAKKIILAAMRDAPGRVGSHFHAAHGVGEGFVRARCRIGGVRVPSAAVVMPMLTCTKLSVHVVPP